MRKSRNHRGFMTMEVLWSALIGAVVVGLMIRAFATFQRKQRELDFEVSHTLGASQFFRDLELVAVQSRYSDFALDADGHVFTLRPLDAMDSSGEKKWSKSLFSGVYDPKSRRLYWGTTAGAELGLTMSPDTPLTLGPPEFAQIDEKLKDGLVQRQTLTEIESFEVNSLSDYGITVKLRLKDSHRQKGRTLERERKFYLGLDSDGGTP